jgi:HSP20 family protein
MTMQRWDPFSDMLSLRQAMNHLLEDAIVAPREHRGSGGAVQVPLDLLEHEDRVVLRASLPGVHPEDVTITVQENLLTLEGMLREDGADDQSPAAAPAAAPHAGAPPRRPDRYHLRERQVGHFVRQVLLPVAVDASDRSRAQASFARGC